jgi:hypothetical protein
MAPEGSTPGPEEPTTGPYSESDDSTPHPTHVSLWCIFLAVSSFSSPQRLDSLWGPPTLLPNGYLGLFLRQ